MNRQALAVIALVAASTSPLLGQTPQAEPVQFIPGPPGQAGFAPLRGAGSLRMDEAYVSGVPEGVTPVVVDLRRAYQLAVVAARSPRKAEGADRAAALDPKVLAAEAEKAGFADFARFRDEWLSARGEDGRSPYDPAADFLDLLRRHQSVESARKDWAARDRLRGLFQMYARGLVAGIARFQVDEVSDSWQAGRGVFIGRQAEYRDALDAFKVRLGLPADAPVVIDRSALDGFSRAFEAIDRWSDDDGRQTDKLDALFDALPRGADLVVDSLSARDAADDDAKFGALMASVSRRAKGDAEALRARKAVRDVVRSHQDAEIATSRLFLAVKRRSRIQDQILAPPAAGDLGATAGNQANNTVKLQDAIGDVLAAEDRLVAAWAGGQARRLEAYRALGLLPFDRWEDFLASVSTSGSAK